MADTPSKTHKKFSFGQKWRVVAFLLIVLALLVAGHCARDDKNMPKTPLSSQTTIDVLPTQPANVPAPIQPVEIVIAETQPGEPVNAAALADNENNQDAEMLAAQIAQATLHLAASQQQPAPQTAHDPLLMLMPLLHIAYLEGGEQARQLANAASTLASQQYEDTPLAKALTLLRNTTPRHGPLTKDALLVQIHQALALQPLSDVETSNASLENTSWWRRQVGKVISLQRVGDQPAVPDWLSALQSVELLIALGNTPDALVSLRQEPLAKDTRLDDLRANLAAFSTQRSYLNQVLNATLSHLTR